MKHSGLMTSLSLLLALVLLAGTVSHTFSAKEDSPFPFFADSEEGVLLLESSSRLAAGGPMVAAALLPGAGDSGALYDQLSDRQKLCYDTLAGIGIDRIITAAKETVDGKEMRRTRSKIKGITDETMKGDYVDGVFYADNSEWDRLCGIYTDLCAALVALRYDRPELLWLDRVRYGIKTDHPDSGDPTITHVVFDFYLEFGGSERSMQQTMLKNAQDIADRAAAQPDTYKKILYVYNTLAGMSYYGSSQGTLSHSPYSALIKGDAYEPVCDGYSKAFKIVCDLMGIPCVTPSSKEHMWNDVKMDDGNWYLLDLTWGDNDWTDPDLKYFLLGTESTVDGAVLSQDKDHTETNPFLLAMEDYPDFLRLVNFRFPGCSKTAYAYAGADQRFPDVARSSWYYDVVEDAAQRGLFQGNDEGLFQPKDNLTRAQFATVLARAMGAKPSAPEAASYPDVPASRWYAGAVAWAKEAGLMQGDDKGNFRPEDPITRQELCVVFAKAAKGGENSEAQPFPDDAAIASWAKDAVYRCRDLGLVEGDDLGSFRPLGNTMRCEAAAVFSRFAALKEQETPAQEDTPPEEGNP